MKNQENRKETDLMKEIRAARAKYAAEWRRKNPEKQAAILQRYWLKKAREMKKQENTTDRENKE